MIGKPTKDTTVHPGIEPGAVRLAGVLGLVQPGSRGGCRSGDPRLRGRSGGAGHQAAGELQGVRPLRRRDRGEHRNADAAGKYNIVYPCKQDPISNSFDWNHKWNYNPPTVGYTVTTPIWVNDGSN